MPRKFLMKLIARRAAPARVLPFFSSATCATNSSARPLCRTILDDGWALPVLQATACKYSLNLRSHDAILFHEPVPTPVVMYFTACPLSGSVNSIRLRRRRLDGAQRANERMKLQAFSLAALDPDGVMVRALALIVKRVCVDKRGADVNA